MCEDQVGPVKMLGRWRGKGNEKKSGEEGNAKVGVVHCRTGEGYGTVCTCRYMYNTCSLAGVTYEFHLGSLVTLDPLRAVTLPM